MATLGDELQYSGAATASLLHRGTGLESDTVLLRIPMLLRIHGLPYMARTLRWSTLPA